MTLNAADRAGCVLSSLLIVSDFFAFQDSSAAQGYSSIFVRHLITLSNLATVLLFVFITVYHV